MAAPTRTPLRSAQLIKPITAYALYTNRHDMIEHDSPPGLRLTLVNDAFVLIEAPAHIKDEHRAEKGVNFRVPIHQISIMEDLVPVKHRLDPDESKKLMQFSVERTNHLAKVDPEPARAPKPAPKQTPVEIMRGKKKAKADAEAAKAAAKEGVTVGHTQDEEALLEDDAADEAAELLDEVRGSSSQGDEDGSDADDE